MKHFGDITKINGYELPIVDCITGGSPCQDLSVAGKRAGLDGERSGLFMEQIRITKEMREHDRKANGHMGIYVKPRFFVWENVPGALSSNNGDDFRIVLEEICKIADNNANVPRPPSGESWSNAGCILGDGWSVAWRIHDAQFWGVPQRRERISVVADFGAETAPEILFERKGVSRDLEPSGEKGQDPSRTTAPSTTGTNFTVKIRGGAEFDADGRRAGKGPLIQEELSGTLGVVQDQTVFCLQGNQIDQADTSVCNGCGWKEDESFTLNTRDLHAVCILENNPTDARLKICEDGNSPTLKARMGTGGNNTPLVMETNQEKTGCLTFGGHGGSYNGQDAYNDMLITVSSTNSNATYSTEVASPMLNRSGTGGGNSPMIANGSCVRRLTPLECERLQGFPDNYTNIGEWIDTNGKKRKTSDAQRYKALGNSIATPFWFWLLRRISAQYDRKATLGSLFDGIGGFPYCWERINGKGSAVWASEIEEFPIAVTKRHFPEESEGDEK